MAEFPALQAAASALERAKANAIRRLWRDGLVIARGIHPMDAMAYSYSNLDTRRAAALRAARGLSLHDILRHRSSFNAIGAKRRRRFGFAMFNLSAPKREMARSAEKRACAHSFLA
jgi:hypothetical protein